MEAARPGFGSQLHLQEVVAGMEGIGIAWAFAVAVVEIEVR